MAASVANNRLSLGLIQAIQGLLLILSVAYLPTPAQAQVADDTRVLLSIQLRPGDALQSYKPPLVAIWLESSEAKPLATISVWYEQARWLPELTEWWRLLGSVETHELEAVSGPTRGPGTFVVEWNGRDRQGVELQQGRYLMAIETTSKGGMKEVVRIPFNLGEAGFSAQATGQDALGDLKLLVLE